MTSKTKKGSLKPSLDNIMDTVNGETNKGGRPSKNPHAREKQLTVRMPADLHKRLDQYRVDTGQPMVVSAIEAILEYLDKHEAKK